MTYLLDTHIFLWALFNPQKLSEKLRKILVNQENTILVSAISFFEISLKYSLGKLELENIEPEGLVEAAEKTGFEIVPVEPADMATFYKLPNIGHRDPFDRLLIWQCIRNKIVLISRDRQLKEYEKLGLKFIS